MRTAGSELERRVAPAQARGLIGLLWCSADTQVTQAGTGSKESATHELGLAGRSCRRAGSGLAVPWSMPATCETASDKVTAADIGKVVSPALQ